MADDAASAPSPVGATGRFFFLGTGASPVLAPATSASSGTCFSFLAAPPSTLAGRFLAGGAAAAAFPAAAPATTGAPASGTLGRFLGSAAAGAAVAAGGCDLRQTRSASGDCRTGRKSAGHASVMTVRIVAAVARRSSLAPSGLSPALRSLHVGHSRVRPSDAGGGGCDKGCGHVRELVTEGADAARQVHGAKRELLRGARPREADTATRLRLPARLLRVGGRPARSPIERGLRGAARGRRLGQLGPLPSLGGSSNVALWCTHRSVREPHWREVMVNAIMRWDHAHD